MSIDAQLTQYFESGAPLTDAGGLNYSQLDMQLAAVALLVETALADTLYTEEEFSTMLNALNGYWRLGSGDAEKIVGLAEMVRQRRGKILPFIEFVRSQFSHDQRLIIYALIWKVIKADGKVDSREISISSALGGLLGLTTDDEIEGRRLLMEGKV
ncbi:MAG: TerB family tellurite resistance protein [Deltaproteobacteria bacterium]|nr:TerB family tellurite resistance protein [Deltaproteobacteria bacterium]